MSCPQSVRESAPITRQSEPQMDSDTMWDKSDVAHVLCICELIQLAALAVARDFDQRQGTDRQQQIKMPHVVFDGTIDLGVLYSGFVPFVTKQPCIIKLNDLFLSQSKKSALVPTIVIDEKNQQFLIEIFAKEQKTTIRLYPGTDPEKTNGVKTSLGYMAGIIKKIFPDIVISKTNIGEFIL